MPLLHASRPKLAIVISSDASPAVVAAATAEGSSCAGGISVPLSSNRSRKNEGRSDLNDPNALNVPIDPTFYFIATLISFSFTSMSSADVSGLTIFSIAAILPVLSM